jgi:putative flippase GtrA|tara:strand:+ start:986 stop:1297 length:312 start_codon:yes stop_codon:yes gene_type:complete
MVDGLHLHVVLGSTIAVILASLYNYCLHYYWTFSSDTSHGFVLIKYLLMCLGGLVINGLVMYFGVTVLSVHYLMVQLLASVMLVLWSFTISFLWVFSSKPKRA